jgi:hypothetical protein
MCNRSFKTVTAGVIAATFAFTAVPAQIILASDANAQMQGEIMVGLQHETYWFRNPENPNQHCKVNVWGNVLNC